MTIRSTDPNIRWFDFDDVGNVQITFDKVMLHGGVPAAIGGGINVRGTSNVLFINGDFRRGTTTGNGGNIFVGNGSNFTSTDGSFSGGNASNGGSVYVESGGTFNLNGGPLSGTATGKGGGVYVEDGGTFNWNGGEIRFSNAVSGGGIYLEENAIFNITDDVSFNGNRVTAPGRVYWIEKDGDEHIYKGRTATELKSLYLSDYASFVQSLSEIPEVSSFTYMWNNADVSYTGTNHSAVSPGSERLVFHDSSVTPPLVYGGKIGGEDVLLPLTSTTPNPRVFNNTGSHFDFRVEYEVFTVNGTAEPAIKFALKDSDGKHNIIEPGTPHTAFTSTELWMTDFITPISWGNGDDGLLLVHIPAFRTDLSDQTISTNVHFSLQIRPSS
jgi:hypothetical protein